VTELPGLDLAALTGWLDAAHPGLRQGELAAEVIAGGKSNLTYRVTHGSTTWALRRPPVVGEAGRSQGSPFHRLRWRPLRTRLAVVDRRPARIRQRRPLEPLEPLELLASGSRP